MVITISLNGITANVLSTLSELTIFIFQCPTRMKTLTMKKSKNMMENKVVGILYLNTFGAHILNLANLKLLFMCKTSLLY